MVRLLPVAALLAACISIAPAAVASGDDRAAVTAYLASLETGAVEVAPTFAKRHGDAPAPIAGAALHRMLEGCELDYMFVLAVEEPDKSGVLALWKNCKDPVALGGWMSGNFDFEAGELVGVAIIGEGTVVVPPPPPPLPPRPAPAGTRN